MKKLVLFLFIGLIASSQADYLLWTVDAATIAAYAEAEKVEVKYARFGRVAGDGSWLYAEGSPVSSWTTGGTEIGTDPISVSGGLDEDAFAVNVNDMGGASYSYYIELLNSDCEVVGRTVANKQYIQYTNLGKYIAEGTIGDVPPATAQIWHGTGFEAVPEPSSMALLALGAGLVGLRRKLRKNKKGKRA